MQTVYLQMRNGNRNSFRSYTLCLSNLPLTDLYSLRSRREWVPVRTSVPNASAKSRAGRDKKGEESSWGISLAASPLAKPARKLAASPQKASRAQPLPPATQATASTLPAMFSTALNTSFITDGVHNENVVLPVYHKDPKYAKGKLYFQHVYIYCCYIPFSAGDDIAGVP